MKKLLNKPWFVIVLVLGALATAGQSLLPISGSPTGSRPENPATILPEPGQDTRAENETLAGGRQEILSGSSIGQLSRDPFAPRVKVSPALLEVGEAVPDAVDAIHLSAIWTQGDATLVLINGRIFQPGDEIGRLRIESATRAGVWVTHWKGRDLLVVGGDFTLHTPASPAPPKRL